MSKHILLSTAALALAIAGGCAASSNLAPEAPVAAAAAPEAPSAVETAAAPAPKPRFGAWGVDLEGGNAAVAAGDDFFRYANGGWLDSFEIPSDLTTYSSFTKLRLEAEDDIRAIVDELAAGEAAPGSLEQKVGDFYAAWMDTAALDAAGAAPLAPHMAKIEAISSKADLMKAFGSLHIQAPFGVGIIPNPMNPAQYVAFVAQAGLGMPDRDYYLKDDETFAGYRSAYKAYMTEIMTLAGVDDAAAKAETILALEKRIAEVHWTQAESRDVTKLINPMTIEQMGELAPEFDWTAIMTELGLAELPIFIVGQTTAIEAAGDIVEDTPLDVWKDYLAYHFVRSNAQFLATDFDRANWEFYAKTLSGAETQRERWKRGVGLINGTLGEAVGKIYVDKHFPEASKAQMDALVGNLTAAFEERLEQNVWMDDETRAQALLKLSTFEPKIGFTEEWTDYTALDIKPGALLDNAIASTEFDWADQISKLSGPVDRVEWPYPPQTVNASYNPLLNQITFPAGILQAPFFDPAADPAVNYGAIGAVIGHEIGHGFDDQGRQFDEAGRFRSWWTETANTAFEQRAERLGSQYDTYVPVEGLNVNGQLTMGENIGDLGGLQMAYAAYRRFVDAEYGGSAPVIDGLTGDQRFFLAWAQVWRGKSRDDALRQQILTDPHSPVEFRVNGVVRNMDAWYEAFGVTEEHALYLAPEERVRIW